MISRFSSFARCSKALNRRMKRFIARFQSKSAGMTETQAIPQWFRSGTHKPISDAITKPVFLFQSWIPEHTDKLVHQIRNESYDIVDLGMFFDPHNKATRQEILAFSEKNGDLFRKMAIHNLAPYRNVAAGLIVTLDWIPAMRHLVHAASLMDIPTILVPHESVFAKADMYYTHPRLGINQPACDLVCAWGELQESIFAERGYPRERIIKTGAPKLDYVSNLTMHEDKDALKLLGLNPVKRTVLFAAQPLDSQYDTAKAREAQTLALTSLLRWIERRDDTQLILRMPPSRDPVFGEDVLQRIKALRDTAIDDSSLYILSAESAISVSDVVISINSTMLLEAALCGKVAISSKFVQFDQIWDNLKIAVATTPLELDQLLDRATGDPGSIIGGYNLSWASRLFSVGAFDGGAADRISDVLNAVAEGRYVGLKGYANSIPFAIR